ncbi:MAG: N-(5'-phosphoribosyl)anthranilate isomerase [Rickettsiales bacterium]|nr:N-(5'-phosphoribosyl)anthranilate isomerase [Rickettsiales bacterium]|tara:strand:- start:1937 stop:2614 length:678 start_codon:yes stop_codon:yes gene_type:complete
MTATENRRKLLIKVCGFTEPDQLRQAGAIGIDLAGVLLWPGSERAVTTEQAHQLSAAASACEVGLVGVFVDEPTDILTRSYRELNLTIAQLHGDERPVDVEQLAREGLRVWKSLKMSPGFHPDQVRAFWEAGAEAVLLDAWHPHLQGGTGQQVDWQVAARLAAQGPLILAGGLSADNAERAVEMVRPMGLDASSALERIPGHKDMDLVKGYVDAARRGLEASRNN